MATPEAAGHHVTDAARAEPGQNHPEPACQEAQKWIEAVTGKSFGDKDFRSALENGILLCELLSAIKPGLVKKINRLPTPIAGLDNLSVFLRGCEELGLKGSQLFDPGDLQDTSIRANLKDSDCNRKLKNVLNTVFWLGKAASGCASYSGPTLNLKEFEGLLAQMKVESEEGGESPQKRSVRDSGYDCWDSERSESLSPPRHTRDNSLDSLDSFGSRSQHSPSPDVVNRVNSDGRGSDSEADAPGKKPDVRKDDMLARRTASSDTRSSIPFNQFLPNRANASAYIPTPRRKAHTEEGEQRSHTQATAEQSRRTGPQNKPPKTVTWAPENNSNHEEKPKQEDELVTQDVLEQRRLQKLEKAGIKVLPAAVRYSSPPIKDQPEVRSPSPNIILRRDNDFLSSQKSAWDSSSDGEEEADSRKVPDVHKDDLASRRAARGTVAPKVHQFIPPPVCSSKDRERWEGIRRASQQTLQEKEMSEKEAVPDIITRRDNPFLNFTPRHKQEEEEEEEEEEAIVQAIPNKQKDDLALRRAQSRPLPHRDGPMSFVSTSMSQADMQKWERLKMTEPSQVVGADVSQSNLLPSTPEAAPSPAEMDACFAQYVRRTEEEEEDEEEEERIPDLRKDDMMARRTGVFHKQSSATVSYNRFLPLPRSKHSTQGEICTDSFPWNKKEVQADGNKKLNIRAEQHQSRVTMETPQPHPDIIRAHSEREYDDEEDEYDENETVPDPEKDDMMARRARFLQKTNAVKTNQAFNQFLPVPGSVKYNVTSVSAMKQVHSRPKITEKITSESSIVTVATESQALPTKPHTRRFAGLRARGPEEEDKKQDVYKAECNPPVTGVTEPLFSPSLTPPLSPVSILARKPEAELDKQNAMERVEEKVEERREDVSEHPRKKPFWLEDDELPPMMMSRRIGFMSEDTESVSMSDMLNEDELGQLPQLSQSRYERMHEQYNNFQDEDDQWQNDLARWKTRRRTASHDLIKKEEERKRIEKMKEGGNESNKRKSIKTYKEIVEEKERREAELCEAYRSAATPEEAAAVLQRYALRFTISDATLDSLKLPRSTSKPKGELILEDNAHKPTSPVNDSKMSEDLHKPESVVVKDPKPAETETKTSAEQEESKSSTSTTPNSPVKAITQDVPPQAKELSEPQSKPAETPTTHQQPMTEDTQPQTKPSAPPHSSHPVHTLPSPPPVSSRPVPLLVAKPYCQPRSSQSGLKPVKMDGLVRVNGEATEDLSVSVPPASPLHSPEENKTVSPKKTEKDVPSEQTVTDQKTAEQPPSPQTLRSTPSSGSAISSLIGGRNCIITTTIVTEMTHVEPHPHNIQSNGQVNGTTGFCPKPEEKKSPPATTPMQDYSPTVTEGLEESGFTIETPMLNLAKRVNHWVWDPNEERKRLERWQQEQERLLQEQYQKEQEKLKKEWERAQLEVEEEERKHNEEERRILEETVTPLNPSGLLSQQSGQADMTPSPEENNKSEKSNNLLLHNGQNLITPSEGQHASKLHFFQDSACDKEASKKQELWKTASLDRNPQQPNQPHTVKRSGSHDAVTSTQQCSPSSPQPPSPSRCVSGKRLCSGCSQPLGKGAAMIIDTLGLFFHMQCFKCGVCQGQLGDATSGTDVRIRNGLLSCHECYIASRGRGQPTTL
uniref:LIM and calponin homology domains 1a n=1 Tax=Sphaeramia orbicularis TaxID=375764 RepID=A0A672ZSJ6_9TELE